MSDIELIRVVGKLERIHDYRQTLIRSGLSADGTHDHDGNVLVEPAVRGRAITVKMPRFVSKSVTEYQQPKKIERSKNTPVCRCSRNAVCSSAVTQWRHSDCSVMCDALKVVNSVRTVQVTLDIIALRTERQYFRLQLRVRGGIEVHR